MLQTVIRPDKEQVHFTYDALGRRLSKTFKSTTTKWLWDGNVPLHEWKENQNGDILSNSTVGDNGIVTWVFEENSFIPTAKLKNNKKFSILADHLGTPTSMHNAEGEQVWERKLDAFGKAIVGDNSSCPFMYQGQYYDAEIDLAYNRFRYYDPEDGRYISQDPIGLLSGEKNFYSYVDDPNEEIDPLGLAAVETTGQYVYGLYDVGAVEPYYIGISNDPARRELEHLDTGRLTDGEMKVLHGQDGNLTLAQARGHEQDLIETHKTKTGIRGEKISETNRGNKVNSFDKNRKDKRGKAFKKAYDDIQNKKNKNKKKKAGYKR